MSHHDPYTFKEIFTPLGAALALFGGLGGLVRALVVRASWRESCRVMIVGAATAFGLGSLSPYALTFLVGDLPQGVGGALGTLCAAAFIVGVVAVALVERFIVKSDSERPDA
jgi:hypothetical protein